MFKMKRACAGIYIIICVLSSHLALAEDVASDGKGAANSIYSMPLSLLDCYRLALDQSELIAIDTDRIKETEAHFLQALSVILPHASFISIDNQQAQSNNAGTTLAALKPARSSERKFNVTQTFFNGFKAFAAIKGSRYERKQRIDELARAQQLLLMDVSDSFYLLTEKLGDYKALSRIRVALLNRVKELKARENLGRSRPSEVVNAKAQLYGVEANLEVVKNQETIARQMLEFLVGRTVYGLTDRYKMPAALKKESYYVSKSDSRPDVLAAGYAWEVARREADVANSDFLPSADFEGNYYVQRTGFNEGTDWDVKLTVTVPIFEGTETLGNSKAAELKAHESKLEYQRVKRRAPYDIKEAYVKLNTALAVHEALRKAYTSAKLNYYLQRKDYERSLVNNLDVLAAIQMLQDTERNYIHAVYEAKRLYWQLKVAIGENIADTLNDTI
ncbi:MAG: TolC family protein [Candidatus Omnitrophota bacterium]|nr:TolC family protein [Candidatus Omnitrophota bacterium]